MDRDRFVWYRLGRWHNMTAEAVRQISTATGMGRFVSDEVQLVASVRPSARRGDARHTDPARTLMAGHNAETSVASPGSHADARGLNPSTTHVAATDDNGDFQFWIINAFPRTRQACRDPPCAMW
jgi:hypothetical protein